ncbi:MAG: hypothetical protein CMI60_22175 [Parvibaculum sp.]|nr:hypothetical protein [Parvibaculum sp.]|tara:strand:+ start:4854 stop:5153 length:300 start_codon:yes stop_codon:yes gene_type:complete
MPRPYSDKFLIGLQSADDERVGIQLAKVCVEAKLPALYIADYFSVTRMTVHCWFRGHYISEKNCIRIQRFIKEIKKDIEKGLLPVASAKKAKAYLSKEV